MRTLLIVGMCVISVAVAGAEEYRVGRSVGTAEIELPDSGWLQAVSGRAVPSGARLSTWLGSGATVASTAARFELNELTVVEFLALGEAAVDLRLLTGVISVETRATLVDLRADGARIRASDALFSLEDGRLLVTTGIVDVEREPGIVERVVAPAEISLVVPESGPLFR